MRKITALFAAISLAGFTSSTLLAGGTACSTGTASAACCSANKATASYKLSNVTCGDSAAKAETALMKVRGVTSAHVCPDSHTAKIEFDKKQTSVRKIASAAKKAGFKATRVRS